MNEAQQVVEDIQAMIDRFDQPTKDRIEANAKFLRRKASQDDTFLLAMTLVGAELQS